jgi:hypothetical protein
MSHTRPERPERVLGGNDKIESNFNVSGQRRSTKSAAIERKSHEE